MTKKIMGKVLNVFDKLFEGLSVFVYLVMIGVVLLQIFARVCLPRVPAWTEEASRYLQVYLVAMAAGAAILNDDFVKVDTIFGILKPKAAQYLKLFDFAVVTVLFVYCFRYSIDMYKLGIPRTAVSMTNITMNKVYFSMILVSGTMLICTIRKIIGTIAGLFIKKEEE